MCYMRGSETLNTGRARCLNVMLTPVGWEGKAAAGFTNTKIVANCRLPIADLIRSLGSIIFNRKLAIGNWQFEIANRQLEIGNENAPQYLSLLPEVPCCESAGSGVLHAL